MIYKKNTFQMIVFMLKNASLNATYILIDKIKMFVEVLNPKSIGSLNLIVHFRNA